MALCGALLRSVNRCGGSINSYRSFYTTSLAKILVSQPKLGSAEICDSVIENKGRPKRPLSPHLTIYKFELTSTLSVMHRTTGIILSGYALILSAAALTGNVGGLIAMIDGWCLPPAILFLGKYALSVPVTYHFFNGIRHLMWDLGKFLTIKQVYSTGYAVVGLSILSAIILSAM